MKNLNIRISDELHTKLKKAAGQDNRSLNSEIITMLDDAIQDRSISEVCPVCRSPREGPS
jgi:predicted HicB family RNase H-like nuclease